MIMKKERDFVRLINSYFDQVEVCTKTFSEAINYFLQKGNNEEFKEKVDSVHRCESKADDLRREVEFKLYSGALLPHSRGDFLGLLEAVDKIPNKLETVTFDLYLENVTIPQKFIGLYKELIDKNIECVNILIKSLRSLFTDLETTKAGIKEVDLKESESDKIERNLIKSIFDDSELDIAQKLVLKGVVINISAISDRAENVGDRIAIIGVKMKA